MKTERGVRGRLLAKKTKKARCPKGERCGTQRIRRSGGLLPGKPNLEGGIRMERRSPSRRFVSITERINKKRQQLGGLTSG